MSSVRRQKISPCLWFDGNAEEAVAHYTSVFKDSKVTRTLRWGDENPDLKGKVLLLEFELGGQTFQALNGGPQFKFSEAISLSVDCADQAEVDYFWKRLLEGGGTEGNCSWLKDRFGLSWQIVPHRLPELLSDPDPARARRAMQSMMTMNKIDIAEIERAANG